MSSEAAIEAHVRRFFAGREVEVIGYDLGPRRRVELPDFRIIEVGPGPRGRFWSYVTAGCWSAVHTEGHGIV